MDPKCFYGKKLTYPNSNNDIEVMSAFSDSDDDPDYLLTRPTTSSF